MAVSKNVAHIEKGCVACGSCAKVCPKGAISIFKGLYAVVNENKCIGCKKCAIACPADIIDIRLREAKIA